MHNYLQITLAYYNLDCHDLAKWLKSLFTLLYFFFLFWTYYTRMEHEKVSHD